MTYDYLLRIELDKLDDLDKNEEQQYSYWGVDEDNNICRLMEDPEPQINYLKVVKLRHWTTVEDYLERKYKNVQTYGFDCYMFG